MDVGVHAKVVGRTTIDLAFVVLTTALLVGCDFGFERDLVRLEIPTAPPQAFQGSAPEPNDVAPMGETTQQATTGFGPVNSRDAIELCEGNEIFGDDDVGSCLAPGGEGYYVWVESDLVILVGRANPHLHAFQIAALSRQLSEGALEDRLANWPKIIPFAVGIGGIAVTCGSTIGAVVSGVGAPISPVTATGCVGSLATSGVTFVSLARDAQAGVEAFVDSHQRASDAKYEFCRMEGGSDEQCRE